MIDQARLQELVNDFGAEDFDDLIDSFLEEAAEVVASLEAMISEDASDERSAQFHCLRGCALNIGAVDLAELCRVHESRDGGFSGADYRSLLSQFQAVQAYFADGGLKHIA